MFHCWQNRYMTKGIFLNCLNGPNLEYAAIITLCHTPGLGGYDLPPEKPCTHSAHDSSYQMTYPFVRRAICFSKY